MVANLPSSATQLPGPLETNKIFFCFFFKISKFSKTVAYCVSIALISQNFSFANMKFLWQKTTEKFGRRKNSKVMVVTEFFIENKRYHLSKSQLHKVESAQRMPVLVGRSIIEIEFQEEMRSLVIFYLSKCR